MSKKPMIRQQNEPFAAQIKRALADDLRYSKYSVEEVSTAMSALSGRHIDAEQIGGFVDEKAPFRFPIDLVPAWVRVTGSRRLLDLMLERV